jgi:hypothetical protein
MPDLNLTDAERAIDLPAWLKGAEEAYAVLSGDRDLQTSVLGRLVLALRRAVAAEAERDRLRAALRAVWDAADDELRRLGAVPGSVIPQIEADARQALAASGITVGESDHA